MGISDDAKALAVVMDQVRRDPILTAALFPNSTEAQSRLGREAANGLVDSGIFQDRGEIADDEVPEWVRIGIAQTVAAWVLDEIRTCQHISNPNRSGLVFATAWENDLLLCQKCLDRARVRRDADKRCDGCGKDFPQGVRGSVIQLGHLIWVFCTCKPCGTWLHDSDRPILRVGVCEFCNIENIGTFEVPVNDFEMTIKGRQFGSTGFWRACPRCAAFAHDGNWFALIVRIVTIQRARRGAEKVTTTYREYLKLLMKDLSQNMTGPPRRIKTEETEPSR